MTTKRATKTPGATETTPAVDQQAVLDEAHTQDVPTSEASASNTGRWVLTPNGWAIKGDV